jgi:hypothetical protein
MRPFALLAVSLLLPSAALPALAQSAASLGNPLNPSSLNKSQDPMDLFMRLQQLSTTGTSDFNSSEALDSAIRNFHKRQQAPASMSGTSASPSVNSKQPQ